MGTLIRMSHKAGLRIRSAGLQAGCTEGLPALRYFAPQVFRRPPVAQASCSAGLQAGCSVGLPTLRYFAPQVFRRPPVAPAPCSAGLLSAPASRPCSVGSRPTPDTVCSVTVCANGIDERVVALAARTLPVQPTRRRALQSVDLAVRNASLRVFKGKKG